MSAVTIVPKKTAAVPLDNPTGLSFDSFSISPSRYLGYLHAENIRLGVHCVSFAVGSLDEVASMDIFCNFAGIVNCTGLGAAKLVPDKAVFPTKGQSLIVKGEAVCVTSMIEDGWETVLVPRSGEQQTFLGVSKVAGDWFVLTQGTNQGRTLIGA